MPSSSDASTQIRNSASISTRSVVLPIEIEHSSPSGEKYQFSGESDGPLSSQPVDGSSTR